MKSRIAVIFSVIIIIAILGNVNLFDRFTITNAKSGRIVYQNKIENCREFYTSFRHSVNKTPVNEYYSISGNKIVLKSTTFYSYGAGMPDVSEYKNAVLSISDGMVHIDNINKELQRFTIFAGTYANHSLNLKDRKIPFTELVKPQTPITFEVKKISMFSIMMSYLSK